MPKFQNPTHYDVTIRMDLTKWNDEHQQYITAKIEGIKLLRRLTGFGLTDAKSTYETIDYNNHPVFADADEDLRSAKFTLRCDKDRFVDIMMQYHDPDGNKGLHWTISAVRAARNDIIMCA